MSALSAREVLIGIVALLVFVAVAVMVAGTNEKAANAILTIMAAFVLLQILFNANLFNQYLSRHPQLTGQAAATSGGQSGGTARVWPSPTSYSTF